MPGLSPKTSHPWFLRDVPPNFSYFITQIVMTQEPPVMELEKLSFAYQSSPIFQELSLQLVPSQLVVLLGANGSGKTTLLKTIARQLVPDSGAITFDGDSIAKLNRRELAKQICLMPQFEQRETSLSVLDVVSLGRSPHAGWWAPWSEQDEAIVVESLQATGLWELRHRTVATLSGGEWRRMVLARSLAQQASVLLLDEPTEGLDLKYQYECLEKIKEIVRQRELIAVVTLHDFQQAAYFADRIAILSGGRLLRCGSPVDVLIPDVIREAFDLNVEVVPNPIHGHPLVVPNVARLSTDGKTL